MNKNINSKVAIAIVAFLATAVTSFFVVTEKREEGKIQESQAAAVIYHKNISRVATANGDKIETVGANGWKLVSGNPDDICTIPVYEGSVRVRGWYVYDLNYEKKKEWLLRIADEDISKLPLFEVNKKREGFHLNVKLEETSAILEKKLKNASAKNPIEIQISRYLAYCEGVPVASIRSAENI